MGYMPYKGTVSDLFPKNGGGNDAKAVEMNTHQQWGEMVLGPGTFPNSLFSASYYDAASKTFTMVGPTNLARDNSTAGFPELNQTGSPTFMFDISPVSDYVMTLPAGPYQTGVTYPLTVTAKNISGNTVTSWNGTVNMVASAGVTLGAAQHVYSPGDSGVWTTTVNFTTAGSKTITATDSLFSLDVKTTLSVTATAPGFVYVLAPGWNMVSVPLVGTGYMASTLPGLLMDDIVSGWNSATKVYDKNFIIGRSPPRNDFAIVDSTGYWVYVGGPTTLHLYGSVPTTTQSRTITVPTGGGWAIIGFVGLNVTRHARDIPAMYSIPGNITTVASYNPITKSYTSWISVIPTVNNFLLVPGQAYWILVGASGTLAYTP
jgi:hypothetical protein